MVLSLPMRKFFYRSLKENLTHHCVGYYLDIVKEESDKKKCVKEELGSCIYMSPTIATRYVWCFLYPCECTGLYPCGI